MAAALPPSHLRLELINERAAIDSAQNDLVAELEKRGYPKASLFAVRLAVHEALTNAFVHGHKNLPDQPVRFEYTVADDHAEIEIEDRGPGFDPASIPDPTLDENLERGCGRGLLLIRAYMSIAEYSASGNVLRMVYQRP
ncbi:MAG TPA: ATP-binding protein [Phycisphaerales bacterium]|nr:ATP-binding protein [Phycisphaerales bacterium]